VDLLPAERGAVDDLRSGLRERFGTRSRQFALFGSRARGDSTELSDLDVLIVVDALDGAEARDIGCFTRDLLNRHDLLVSTFAASFERMTELRKRERRIDREIDRDGVPL